MGTGVAVAAAVVVAAAVHRLLPTEGNSSCSIRGQFRNCWFGKR